MFPGSMSRIYLLVIWSVLLLGHGAEHNNKDICDEPGNEIRAGSCADDDTADDVFSEPNINRYVDVGASQKLKEISENVLTEYGFSRSLFKLESEKIRNIVEEMAETFSRDNKHTEFSHYSEVEKKLLFIKHVKEINNQLEKEEKEREIDIDPVPPHKLYQFPPLSRLDPGKVGDEVEVELVAGRTHRRITRAVHPPVFEIPDFLTSEECDLITQAAGQAGLVTSQLFGADLEKEMAEEERAEVSRISDQTWLHRDALGQNFSHSLMARLSKLTDLPVDLLERSEMIQIMSWLVLPRGGRGTEPPFLRQASTQLSHLQALSLPRAGIELTAVVKYRPGGHYHAHIDTTDNTVLPCCFQTDCGELVNTPRWSECCRLCRYITVMYYLNDVELGGETAFPLADMPDELYQEKMTNIPDQSWYNLSYYCHNSSLVVKPRRGTAIMWYSHFLDDTGYLGAADQRSHHGGCDLLAGTKWIANNWISGTTYENRFKPSTFH